MKVIRNLFQTKSTASCSLLLVHIDKPVDAPLSLLCNLSFMDQLNLPSYCVTKSIVAQKLGAQTHCKDSISPTNPSLTVHCLLMLYEQPRINVGESIMIGRLK